MLTLMRDYAAQARTASGINILLGISLIVSPWVFDYSGSTPEKNCFARWWRACRRCRNRTTRMRFPPMRPG